MDTLEQYLIRRSDDAPPPLLSEGTQLGLWKICALLARGGSGEVYRAQDTEDGSFVAIKVLFRTDEASQRRFLREAKIFSSLTSKSFPRIFGTGTFEGHPWFAMELLEPCDLPQNERDIATFLLNISVGVAELHRLGYVHRDIKPANIMRRDAQTCVLIDLGLVKAPTQPLGAKGNSISIVDGHTVGLGTIGYAAPEQLVGADVSTASDIHALGVLANTCFHDNPPRAWKRIILKATSSLPDYRYHTIDEFLRAIRRRHTVRNILRGLGLALLLILVGMGSLFLLHATATLPETLHLQGETLVLNKPIRLKQGTTLTVIGPGRLEADISGEAGSCLALTNCVVMNATSVPLNKSGIKYELRNDVYLNFTNLDTPKPFTDNCFVLSDGKYNTVRFKGPLTVEALNHLLHEEAMNELLEWIQD